MYRFVSTSGTITSVSPSDLMTASGTICTVANTTCTSMFGTVKVNRIEIWTPPASQGASATCSCEFFGTSNTPSREFSDTSISVATPAHLVAVPPPQSLASFWQGASGTALFKLTAPVGSIIDVWLSLIMNDDEVTIVTRAVSTATLGSIYYLGLDSTATTRYVPVSLTTTV